MKNKVIENRERGMSMTDVSKLCYRATSTIHNIIKIKNILKERCFRGKW